MVTNFDPVYPDCKDPHSFQSGLEFQDFVVDLLREKLGIIITNYQSQKFQFGTGENKQGIEIKLDRLILRTKKVSIEVAEKAEKDNAYFVPSGIYRYDNSWLYIQGNYDIVFIFAKSTLQLLHKSKKEGKYIYPTDTLDTVKRFLLPIEKAKKYAAKVLILNDEQKKLKRWINNGHS